MNVALVILNYKSVDDTLQCLESIKNSNLPPKTSFQTIVVDNHSEDGSWEKLEKVDGIKLIASDENLGYSGGNNVGIKYALNNNADFILILNNDVTLHRSAIKYLLESRQEGDIIAPKIYFAAGFEFHRDRYNKTDLGNVIWYAGGKIDWDNIIGLHIGVDEVDTGQYDHSKQINFATGACLFVKREVFEKIGFFDEKYFLYLEDLDFCVRAKKNKFKIFFQPKAVLWHRNAASAGGSGSNLQDYYITRNRLLFAFKFAKLKTKFALLRQIIFQSKNPLRRRALFDFLTFHFGKSDNFN